MLCVDIVQHTPCKQDHDSALPRLVSFSNLDRLQTNSFDDKIITVNNETVNPNQGQWAIVLRLVAINTTDVQGFVEPLLSPLQLGDDAPTR